MKFEVCPMGCLALEKPPFQGWPVWFQDMVKSGAVSCRGKIGDAFAHVRLPDGQIAFVSDSIELRVVKNRGDCDAEAKL